MILSIAWYGSPVPLEVVEVKTAEDLRWLLVEWQAEYGVKVADREAAWLEGRVAKEVNVGFLAETFTEGIHPTHERGRKYVIKCEYVI